MRIRFNSQNRHVELPYRGQNSLERPTLVFSYTVSTIGTRVKNGQGHTIDVLKLNRTIKTYGSFAKTRHGLSVCHG